ncbi:hypothetical protein RJ640_015989 [Escallonia rubra]|uniref:N(6)-L-threonylcarbamoyladenine synthase n=1 Tax=Escallonia rubra TaxID=112253 RepID=A0AA88RAI0_9ASTE|nr:hypothetical protein RJ640_015989 [Escallonia rubra]
MVSWTPLPCVSQLQSTCEEKLFLIAESCWARIYVADLLVRYGGVAPKMAEEAHSQVIDQVVQDALDKANLTPMDLSAVAVTIGPGLSLCLRVGVQKARRIAGTYSLPVVGVHHMEAHALVARERHAVVNKYDELPHPWKLLN